MTPRNLKHFVLGLLPHLNHSQASWSLGRVCLLFWRTSWTRDKKVEAWVMLVSPCTTCWRKCPDTATTWDSGFCCSVEVSTPSGGYQVTQPQTGRSRLREEVNNHVCVLPIFDSLLWLHWWGLCGSCEVLNPSSLLQRCSRTPKSRPVLRNKSSCNLLFHTFPKWPRSLALTVGWSQDPKQFLYLWKECQTADPAGYKMGGSESLWMTGPWCAWTFRTTSYTATESNRFNWWQ